jgi:cytochrome c-type biogenesis protein CcmH/NrfG
MTGALIWLMLCALAALAVLLPLWSRRADVPLGRGSDGDEPEREWQAEKDRLVRELRELDVAQAEGRITAEIHDQQHAALSVEAEQALARLRRARSGSSPKNSEHTPQQYPGAAVVAAFALFIVSGGVTLISARGDVQRGTSPHADGRMLLAPSSSAAGGGNAEVVGSQLPRSSVSKELQGLPLAADGSPDVGKMVARLEEKVKSGEPSVDDLMMLGRSYRVLGRDEEAISLLKQAAQRAPNRATLLAYGEALFRSGGDARLDEAAQVFDHLLSLAPGMPEALWYKSLALVKRHKVNEARGILRDLKGLVVDNAEASRAVGELLAVLDQVGTVTATPPVEK